MSQLIRQYEQAPFIAKLLFGLAMIGLTTYYAWDEFVIPKQLIVEEKEANKKKIDDEFKLLNRDFVSPVTMEEELTVANREFKRLVESLPQDASVDRVLNDFASLSRVTGSEIREFKPTNELKAISLQNKLGANGQVLPPPLPINPQDNQNQNAVKELQDVNAVGLQVKMFGTFTAIISFLDMAMSLPRVVRIQDFQILNPEREIKLTQRPKLTFNGFFYAYFQKPDGTDPMEVVETAEQNLENSPTRAIGKPAVDLNEVLDTSFSAKPLDGESK